MSQLESEKKYLDKSNKHLEKILEATNAYKQKEVSELNRIHVETIKVRRWYAFVFLQILVKICYIFVICLKMEVFCFGPVFFVLPLSVVSWYEWLLFNSSNTCFIRFSPHPPKCTTCGPVLWLSPAQNTWMARTIMWMTFGPSSLLQTWLRWPWLRNCAKYRYSSVDYPSNVCTSMHI